MEHFKKNTEQKVEFSSEEINQKADQVLDIYSQIWKKQQALEEFRQENSTISETEDEGLCQAAEAEGVPPTLVFKDKDKLAEYEDLRERIHQEIIDLDKQTDELVGQTSPDPNEPSGQRMITTEQELIVAAIQEKASQENEKLNEYKEKVKIELKNLKDEVKQLTATEWNIGKLQKRINSIMQDFENRENIEIFIDFGDMPKEILKFEYDLEDKESIEGFVARVNNVIKEKVGWFKREFKTNEQFQAMKKILFNAHNSLKKNKVTMKTEQDSKQKLETRIQKIQSKLSDELKPKNFFEQSILNNLKAKDVSENLYMANFLK